MVQRCSNLSGGFLSRFFICRALTWNMHFWMMKTCSAAGHVVQNGSYKSIVTATKVKGVGVWGGGNWSSVYSRDSCR